MKSILFVFFVLLIFSVSVTAQKYQIKKLGLEQGISNNYVLSISQDRKGFLWFATESGLNRFDGNKFKVYKKRSEQSSISSISGNELNRVYADKYEDIVWVATQREGLNMFDYKTETFTHYKYSKTDSLGIITNDITNITNSIDSNIWISTYYGGVEYFDKKNKQFIHYNRKTVPGMVSDNIWTVSEGNKGLLYIGHVASGLSILSLKDKKIKNFRHDPNNTKSIPSNDIRTIFIDKNENIWVGTSNGLALFNTKDETFIVFKHNPANKNSLISNSIFSIFQDQNGSIWVGTEKGGISVLDLKQSIFLTPQTIAFDNIIYKDDYTGLSNPTIRSVYQDSFGNMWIGTYGGGVNFISHQPPLFKTWVYSPAPNLSNSLSNPIAWGICTDNDDRIWVGTDGGGIDIFENEIKIKTISKNKGGITDDAILTAKKDSDNNLWFGTFRGGVIVFNSQSKVISQFLINNTDTDVRCFYEDEDGSMLIGSSIGIYRYNLATKHGELYSAENSGLHNNLIRAISKDDSGKIWIGFFGEGLAILDKDLKRIKSYKTDKGLPSNTVDCIYKDTKGRMWVATGEGLICFKAPEESDNFVVFNEKNTFRNTHVRGIAEDADNNIWISTNDGISRLIDSLDKFYHYDYRDGVPLGDFMSNSVTKDSQGRIFFGSQNGICYFDPTTIPTHIKLPPTVITGFTIYNNQSLLSDNKTDIPIDSCIELDYNQNTFNISFNVLDYSLRQQVEYSYTLKGLEERWYDVGNEGITTFRNIPPGDYELLIRSRIKNQEWVGNVTSLRIIINPPIWLTWWSKMTYIIVIIGIIFFILRFYKRRLALENSFILEKRNRIQEQILNDERLRFFTNITHELRTPLTLVLGPLEDLQNDPGLSEKHSYKVSIMYKSATRLLNLTNQILEFRKTETQNKKLSVQKGDISLLIREIGMEYQELRANNNIKFEMIIDTQNTNIFFDADIVTTILENLLSNAFKYTQNGVISLIIRNITDNEIEYIEIEVKDTGRGISHESITKIFDRYYQADDDKHISGTGIGLALVQNLVSIHEGEILVNSRLGEGTSFRFRIKEDNTYPNAKHIGRVVNDNLNRTLENSKIKNENSTNNQLIILVVEDDEDILNYIKESLSDQYTIHTANNGKTGLEYALLHIPDIIISDVMMPEMNGFELSRSLKENISTSHIPIILLTAKDSIQDRTEGYKTGADSYMIKPFSANLLQSRITNLLETRKKQADLINRNTIKKSDIIIDALNKIDNEFIKKVTSIIEQNLDSDKIDVAFIADRMNMSHSSLYRKIKALCGISVNEYIRKVRISNAEQLLLSGKYTISEISYMVGINSITYFRQCFKNEFGVVPSEYVKKIMSNDKPSSDI